MAKVAPEGWAYEAPEPSNYNWSGFWIHDSCEADVVETIVGERVVNVWPSPAEGEDPIREVEFTYQLTCTGCHATVTVRNTELA